ncbi:hypothetical protein FIU54_14165, partial [Enterococcus faecium]|uniref:hypothetical protein n=1 Tax=Enterococcus faecium TaxID=1352 RepID=UPI00111DF9CF
MKNFDTYYVIVFSISLLLILLTLMQYKEYPEYFILTFVYLVSSYTLLYKFRSSWNGNSFFDKFYKVQNFFPYAIPIVL